MGGIRNPQPGFTTFTSKRLNDQFIVEDKMGGPCAQCRGPVITMISVSYAAGFCCPGCYLKFERRFREHMKEMQTVNTSLPGWKE